MGHSVAIAPGPLFRPVAVRQELWCAHSFEHASTKGEAPLTARLRRSGESLPLKTPPTR
jgi:hypothetical protein